MKKAGLLIIYLICLSVHLFSMGKEPSLYRNIDEKQMEHWVDSVFDSMTFKERVGQLFVLGVDVNLSARNKELVKKYIQELKIGGILFTKGTAKAQAELTNYCQSLSKVPLMITLDGEWGLSMRLTDTPKFPINMTLGAIENDSLIYAYGKEVGRQCRRMGIHVNFAPVLDVNSNENNPVIGRRSFGESPEKVAHKAIAYARGLESEGVLSVGKHFPGHGDTSDDSHKTLPIVNQTRHHLEKFELVPFKKYINSGLGGLMVGHLNVPAFDNYSQLPASLSPAITDTLLQQKMKFKGLVFTDALEMKGASEFPNLAAKALLAGNDILLKPLSPITKMDELLKAIDDGVIPHSLIEEKCLKVLRYKYILGLNHYSAIPLKNLNEDLNTRQTQLLIQELYAAAITILKDTKEILPLKMLGQRTIAAVAVGKNDETPFQKMLGNYASVEPISLTGKMPTAKQSEIISQLDKYNTIIVGIHSGKKADITLARRICQNRNTILVFFTSPYQIKGYQDVIKKSQAVILAYEDNATAQEYAAQILFGGYGAQGKLPVNINNLFTLGKGTETQATRLRYTLPEATGMNSDSLDKIAPIVKEGISAKAFPGCQILIAHKGKIIYSKSFGYFDYAGTHPVQNTDVYDLASVTKATATLPAIMKLYDDHKLSFHQKLSNYIPQLKADTHKKQITIKDALYHETGLASTLSVFPLFLDRNSYGNHLYQKKRDNDYRIQIDRQLYAHKDARLRKDMFSTSRSDTFPINIAENLYATPKVPDTLFTCIVKSKTRNNKNYLYSCLNFILLQKAVENITQQPLNLFLNKNFYAPLGATTTTYLPLTHISRERIAPTENDALLRNQIIIGYPHDELAAFSGGVSGNAGLFSSANDLAKLLQMYLNQGEYGGERYISAHTVASFTRAKSENSRRGLGFDKPNTNKPEASPTCPEAPASVYGHTGFTGTAFWVDPDNDLIFIFLSNRVYAHRWNKNLMTLNIRPRIQSIIYSALK